MTELVRLARPTKLVCNDTVVEFPTNYVLASPVPMVGCLYLFPSTEERDTRQDPSEYSFDAFRDFHGRDGNFVSEVEFPNHWQTFEDAFEIFYVSRKLNGGGDGTLNTFRHRFARDTIVKRAKHGWFRISGSGLYVCDRGIVN